MTYSDFGRRIRQRREELEIGLRELARKVSVSPAYLSMVERGELPPPAEDKVLALAQMLGLEPDQLLAAAGRVAEDVTDLVREHAEELPQLIRKWPALDEGERRTILASARLGAKSFLRATAVKVKADKK
ncbi:MAG: helix-turn-helix domain-containing protein [Hyphomicrobiales bacterium]